jgi:hypothetical protein
MTALRYLALLTNADAKRLPLDPSSWFSMKNRRPYKLILLQQQLDLANDRHLLQALSCHIKTGLRISHLTCYLFTYRGNDLGSY